jgi:DNA invertase Pin-like site-specific DNA recombinase
MFVSDNFTPASRALRAAIYLRVSTGKQAQSDLSIPDQRRQIEGYCKARGWVIAQEFVDAGISGTDENRPAFQRLLDLATNCGAPFDVVVVHSFSRFARDHLVLGFEERKLRRHRIRLVSITQELDDEPSGQMARQLFGLFDEYQSKENAKHTLRALKENARQGFWNGTTPPHGYALVVTEQRGAKLKKRLAEDALEAETVRLAFRLFLQGDGKSGPLGIKKVTSYLNEKGLRTRGGARWGTVKSIGCSPTPSTKANTASTAGAEKPGT